MMAVNLAAKIEMSVRDNPSKSMEGNAIETIDILSFPTECNSAM